MQVLLQEIEVEAVADLADVQMGLGDEEGGVVPQLLAYRSRPGLGHGDKDRLFETLTASLNPVIWGGGGAGGFPGAAKKSFFRP